MKKNNPFISAVITFVIILVCVASAFFIPGIVLNTMAEKNNYKMVSVENAGSGSSVPNDNTNALSSYEQMRIICNHENTVLLNESDILDLSAIKSGKVFISDTEIKSLITDISAQNLFPFDYNKNSFYNWNIDTIFMRETTLNSFVTYYNRLSLVNSSQTEIFNFLVSEDGILLYAGYSGYDYDFRAIPSLEENYKSLDIVNGRACTFITLSNDTVIPNSYSEITIPPVLSEVGILIIGTENSYTSSDVASLYNENFDRYEFYYVFRSSYVDENDILTYVYCLLPYVVSQ